jgi:2,3-bisphosphoglycerate-independent phosphoglycerate mutase
MRQGPLTISALDADPPDRSTHFHLSLLSFENGMVSDLKLEILPEEATIITDNASRLNTKLLTFVKGEAKDHGLVWEAQRDLATYDPRSFDKEPIKPKLPEGDGETLLRRYIDDSINLFSEMDFNLRRVDEGLPPLNLLWPWGHGERQKVPNLALRRGEPATVESSSLRLAGLTRLAGYRHADRKLLGRGVRTQFRSLAKRLLKGSATIAVIDAAAELRSQAMWEELEWFVREMDTELIAPLLEATIQELSRLTLIAPGEHMGLAVTLEKSTSTNTVPFDERALEERTLSKFDLSSLVESGLTS